MTNPRTRRRSRALAATVACATLLGLAPMASAAPVSSVALARQGAEGEAAIRQHAIEAAAAASRRTDVPQRRTPPGHANATTAVLDDALAKIVGDGAIGVAARLDSPALTWAGAAGLRDIAKKPRANDHDRFEIASITKVMTAILVLQEVEKGTWQLDQRVDEVVPGIFPGHEYVTFRQLLSHTSGAPNGTNEIFATVASDADLMAVFTRDWTAQDHLDLINAVPWGEPGQYFYSNGGYIALGLLLEEQNRTPLARLMRDRIWKPAKMNDTSLPSDPVVRGRMLLESAWTGVWFDLSMFDPDFFLASGAGESTTGDLNKLTRALVTGKLVDRALVEEMIVPVSADGVEYGLGVYRLADPCEPGGYLYGHDGATFGTLSMALTSLDGTRQMSVAGTGRDLATGRWSYLDVMIPMMLASCPS